MQNKYNIGCIAFLIILGTILIIYILISFLITKLIIWFILGIFNYNLSNKFWYIFVAITIILPALKSIFTININK